MPKVRLWMETGYVGGEREEILGLGDLGFTEETWANLTEDEKEEVLEKAAQEYVWEYVSCGAEVIDD